MLAISKTILTKISTPKRERRSRSRALRLTRKSFPLQRLNLLLLLN